MQQSRTLTKSELTAALKTSLRRWHSPRPGDPFESLVLYRNLQRRDIAVSASDPRRLITDGLEQLSGVNPDGAKILRMHYMENHTVKAIAVDLALHEATVYEKQSEAVTQLADLLYNQEVAAHAAVRRESLGRLEQPTYLQLFGIEEHVTHLLGEVERLGPPWLIVVEGIGGIGKTSLADSLARRMIDRMPWHETAWVTARQQSFNLGGNIDHLATSGASADALVDALCSQLLPDVASQPRLSTAEKYQILRSKLKSSPHLVIVDNLETVQDADMLVSRLREMAEPSKFVLTTRASMFQIPGAFHFRVPPLSRASSLDMIRNEAEIRNLPAVAAAGDDDLAAIYDVVGGNPLALRLVVGQLHVHDLSAVLYDLASVQSRKVENLYSYVYRRAWDNLDEYGRRVLLTMPLTGPQGGEIEFLAAVCGLSDGDLRRALDALVSCNLVDARGGLQHHVYSIHSLTRTFLQEQVAKWQPTAPN